MKVYEDQPPILYAFYSRNGVHHDGNISRDMTKFPLDYEGDFIPAPP